MEKIIFFVFGLIFGSFLNVVIYRLPLNQSLWGPRSLCPHCRHLIRFFDNIPVVSYLILLGRCRYCRQPISIQYVVVELITGIGFLLCYLYFSANLIYMVMAMVFLLLLIALAFIDFTHYILPDELTLGGAILFAVYSFFNPVLHPLNAILSALGSALVFYALYFFYLKLRKIEGLGMGDVKMMLLLGAFLGLKKVVIATLLASVFGMLVGLFFIVFKQKDMKFALPFGTFLGFGSAVSLFWGEIILKFLQSFFLWSL
jgi:leader peptidase (prepilin peptidase)/N-methyltransferase